MTNHASDMADLVARLASGATVSDADLVTLAESTDLPRVLDRADRRPTNS